ncbi:MAG TPA: DUF2157 domain-containing protein [Acidobacteriaceae bacterium]|nr:DUF2157 domain-containing protein [Acidobacteriaceae bacterium]
MEDAEQYVARWQAAGLLDESTAAAIRAYETKQTRPQRHQWQVLLALILGGILLGAGVLLFVAANWDKVSPTTRMILVLSMLVFFHGFGLLAHEKFAGLATAMHAVGTMSAGAAIALIGQIFNMQEHWPAAILLWALCAAAGWILLRDQFQQTLTLLLIPAWIVSELVYRASAYNGADIYIARVLAVIGAVYLSAFLHSRKHVVSGVLFSTGAILLPISVGILAEGGWNMGFQQPWGFVPLSYRLAALGILLLAGIFGAMSEKQSIVPVSIAAVVAYVLPWSQKTVAQNASGFMWKFAGPGLLTYLIVAAAAVSFVWWGVRTSAKALVNYGMVAFALTVIWFYFSSVMDRLGRSLGLILLGVLFLAGGWGLEQTRRKLVRSIDGGAA